MKFRINRPLKLVSYVIFLLLLMMINSNGCGQGMTNLIYNANESFFNMPEGVIKNEIASFTASKTFKKEYYPNITLKEIPLKKCSDRFVIFEKGNIYASEYIINIESTDSTLSKIAFIQFLHYKFGFYLPDTAISDIFNPRFCKNFGKKAKHLISDCKVLQSQDESRIYIYMLNGQGEDRFEVTWIIQDDRYYKRVIEFIN